ncbi:NAD-dependent epimerase/dehydratase family protein [Candidatus Parcubacteria bacterium]|nr:NAD-dependent epimerase/dehydratase family protein [Candidatus Parcubacteria bacterium]
MKIVVTGAAGAIGSHLAERFVELGHTVVGIDALKPYYDPNIKKINATDLEKIGVEMHYIDLTTDEFDSLLKDVDIIFHCAAQPGISATTPFQTYLDDNIIATHRLLEVAKKVPTLKAFIHASTSSVYGARATEEETAEPKPTSNYGVTKLASEQLAMSYYRESGLPVIVLRFFSVYGPRERPEKLYHKLIKSILEDKPMPLHEGSEHHVRSYTFISDIVDGCVLVTENVDKAVGEIFNLGTDKTMTTKDGIEIIESLLGRKAKFNVMPRRPGDQIETGANISKMRKFFGYNPKVPLQEGLKKQVEWYKEKIHKHK